MDPRPSSRPPQRIALLIGSPYDDLQGVATDIEAIDARLKARKFERRRCAGPDATRAMILRQLLRLRDEARPDDAIVVYYAGHGGRAHLRDAAGVDSPAPHNFLVPIDYTVPTDHAQAADSSQPVETCRGVADFELRLLFHEISERTRNVTVILDCCHSSTMVRGDERSHLFGDDADAAPTERERRLGGARLYRMPPDMAFRHEEYLRRRDQLHGDHNPHIVRIVATAAGSSAFEARNGDHHQGYLTRELCAALRDTEHAPVCWDAIIRRVRDRIFSLRRSHTQRPELEGPRDRIPFSLDRVADVVDRSTLTYASDGTPFVRMGRLHGLHPDDRLEVLDHRGATVARADVDELFDDSTRVVLRTSADPGRADPEPGRRPPGGSVVSVSSYERRRSVWIDPATALRGVLRAQVDAQMRLRPAHDPQAADFRVRGDGHRLRVEGPAWLRRVPAEASPEQATRLVHDLDDVARGLILREQLAGPDSLPPDLDLSVELWVSLPGRSFRPFVDEEELPTGAQLYLDIQHHARGMPPLYVNVLDRGVSGRLFLLSQAEPAGIEVKAPEGKGSTMERFPEGFIGLEWPPDVPSDRSMSEEFMVVATVRPVDLRDLTTLDPTVRTRGREPPTTRSSARVEQAHPDRWLGRSLPRAVRRFRFRLRP